MTFKNHIWQKTILFKALIAIFWDLQSLWPSSLTKPDLLRFRCSSGHVLSKTKSVTPHSFTFLTSLTHQLSMVKFLEKKSMLQNFRANVLKILKQAWWSNDKTIVELSYRRISWFVSVSQINYLPRASDSANNWSARHWQITIFCSTSSIFIYM